MNLLKEHYNRYQSYYGTLHQSGFKFNVTLNGLDVRASVTGRSFSSPVYYDVVIKYQDL